MTLSVLRERFAGLLEEGESIPLDVSNVPGGLRPYVAYAEVCGISDDGYREALVERAPEAARRDLVQVVELIDDQLDEWLAGPEADRFPPTPEYVAFSAMRMAADYIGVEWRTAKSEKRKA